MTHKGIQKKVELHRQARGILRIPRILWRCLWSGIPHRKPPSSYPSTFGFLVRREKIAKALAALAILSLVLFSNPFLPITATVSAASFTQLINYQAKLTNSSSIAVADGNYNLEFKIYDSLTGGNTLWTETRTSANRVAASMGVFSVMLGDVTPINSLDFNQPLYLGVNVGGTGTIPIWDGEMTPRKRIGAVPAAFEADKIDGIDSGQLVRNDSTSTIATSSANTVLVINQTGAGNVLDVKSGGTSVFQVLNSGTASSSSLLVSNSFTLPTTWTGLVQTIAGVTS
ncbi:MAG: hypothetical protein AAB645_02485, partial [Patescibacteria group bacterium]